MALISNLQINNTENFDINYEVVERKGLGHPDTLCDILAEKISASYSRYCLENFGCVLRHMIDKLTILGGVSEVRFGSGEVIKPFRILLNGRFTSKVENQTIPYLDIANHVIASYLETIFIQTENIYTIYEIIDNTHTSPGPGVVFNENKTNNERQHFFDAPSIDFLKNHGNANRANDTSTVVAYTTNSIVERLAIKIEQYLNFRELKNLHLYIGSDIKVMICRNYNNLKITACVPLISRYVKSKNDYRDKLDAIKKLIVDLVTAETESKYNFEIYLNTRDNFENDDLYLTVTGSATESGDEGVVGRGNRYNGIIPFNRHVTLEACCGKNPIYHVGKIYMAVAKKISEQLFSDLLVSNVVYISSQMGASLDTPNYILIELDKDHSIDANTRTRITEICENNFANISQISLEIINETLKLY